MFNRLCRDGRLYDVERWIQEGRFGDQAYWKEDIRQFLESWGIRYRVNRRPATRRPLSSSSLFCSSVRAQPAACDLSRDIGAVKAVPRLRRPLQKMMYFSAVSGWEIAIKVRLGRVDVADGNVSFVAEQVAANGFQVLPVHLNRALRTGGG
jgi:hypothetical protein